jgi:hypothetical protein
MVPSGCTSKRPIGTLDNIGRERGPPGSKTGSSSKADKQMGARRVPTMRLTKRSGSAP